MRLIDADAMLEYLDLMYDKQDGMDDPYNVGVLGAINYIKHKAPTIDADRPKGEWIDTGKDKEHLHPLSARWYRCSVCGLETNAKTSYCFDCGADMRGADNESV